MSSTESERPSPRPASPRVPPLPPEERDAQAVELLAQVGVPGSGPSNIFATLVRHPGLLRKWLPFGGKLLTGVLAARDRELLILRTAWRCQAEYEWGQHARLGLDAGLTDDELERIKEGPGAGWSAADATLLRAADELHDGSCIADETWRSLRARFDDRQLIEIPMLVGQYHLVAFTLNTLGVEREPGVPGFAP